MNQSALKQKVNREKVLSQCSLTIMEAAMVWELLLVGYQQLAEIEIQRKCSRDSVLKEFARTRQEVLFTQVKDAETLMTRSGMPLPVKKPTMSILLHLPNDIQMLQRLFTSCHKRISGIIAIIASMVTNTQLRFVMIEFLKEELDQLEKLCHCTVSLNKT